ncbi:MAG TPA: SCO family protein [Streptosporangiaceae bacterium]|nr:SCO family protein [Streptosporangiaceae bacterium]
MNRKSAPAGGIGRITLLVTLACVVAAAAIVGAAYVVVHHSRQSASAQTSRVSGIPATVSTSLSNLMSLSPLPSLKAPAFTLTDQTGRTLSLSDLRGKVVVLEFMDPHCTDICPIVSQEFVQAYHNLGSLADRVVFAAVNVNAYHHRVADVAKFSREQQLTSIPSWHFFTAAPKRLAPVWRAYNIQVQAPNPNADIVHTSAVYVIDQQGRERYVASPQADHTKSGSAYLPAGQITSWGRGLALLAAHLAA